MAAPDDFFPARSNAKAAPFSAKIEFARPAQQLQLDGSHAPVQGCLTRKTHRRIV